MLIISLKRKEHLKRISKIGTPLASQKCKEMRLERIKNYNNNPKLCKNCNSPISYDKKNYNDFCSKKCSAIYNNINGKIGRRRVPKRLCECGKTIKTKDENIIKCYWCRKKEITIDRINDIEKKMISLTEVKLNGDQIKMYLLYMRGHECERCHNKIWNGVPIPLSSHHIDGNYLHNHPNNLKLLCPNCHAQTDNYCRKNNPVNKRKVYEHRK